jgi:hypothetical protein
MSKELYIGNNLQKVVYEPSLSEKRYKDAMNKKYKTIYSVESDDQENNTIVEGESLVVPPEVEPELDEKGDSEERSEEKYFGKDVVISPVAYYTVSDSLKHALNDYREQISRTVRLVMDKRQRRYGQRVATLKDRNDVLGEYPEKTTTETIVDEGISTGPGLSLKRHYFTRPIDGIMYRITIDEQRTGVGQNRRNTYMLVDIAVIFYRKNGVGLGKEIIVRSKVLRFRKRAPRN